MILVGFTTVVDGMLPRLFARLIHLSALMGGLPAWLYYAARALGMVLLSLIKESEGRLVRDNLQHIIGLDEGAARRCEKQFFLRKSAGLIHDRLFERRYFSNIEVDAVYLDDAAYPESGCLFALVHSMDVYLIPPLVARHAVARGAQRLYLLRAPLSPQESKKFDVLSAWAGVTQASTYLNPRSATHVRTAIRAMREGDKLLSFVDTPAEFGRSPAVSLFGRRAWMSLGAVDLARAAGVPIYLTWLRPHPERPNALQLTFLRIESGQDNAAQVVATAVEDVIRAHPSSWDYVNCLRSYFYLPKGRAS